MMKSRMLPLIMTATLLATAMSGCGGGGKGGKDGDTGGTGGVTRIDIMANLHTAEVPSDRIEKILEEKTNTELNIQWVPDGSYEEKLNAAFATDSLPMATFLKNQTSLIMFRDAIRNGQFWEIGPYIDEFPNLKRLDKEVLKNTAVDGKIYALYQERPAARSGIIYRKDWADKLGLGVPKTIDDVYNMLKAFKERDPDGNNQNDTIGLADRNDLVYGAWKTIASWFGTPNNFYVKDGEIRPEFEHPAYMETLKFFRKLYQEGLINQDFPVTSKSDQQNLFITGKAGMYIGSMGDVASLYPKMAELNPNVELDVTNVIEGGPQGYGIWAIPGYGSVVLFPKSAIKSEEQLKKVLGFFDKLMDPEIAVILYSGLEGVHYNRTEDGLIAPVSDVNLTNKEVKPYQALQIGGPSTIDSLRFYYELPVKAKAEELTLDNNKYLIQDPTAALDSPTYAERGLRLQELIKDATYKFILGNIDEAGFQKAIDQWMNEGGKKALEEFTASYKASL